MNASSMRRSKSIGYVHVISRMVHAARHADDPGLMRTNALGLLGESSLFAVEP